MRKSEICQLLCLAGSWHDCLDQSHVMLSGHTQEENESQRKIRDI